MRRAGPFGVALWSIAVVSVGAISCTASDGGGRSADASPGPRDGAADAGCTPGSCPDGFVCVAGACVDGSSDEDGDGFVVAVDCDDGNPTIGSMAERPCESECAGGVERCSMGRWQPCNAPSECLTCEIVGGCQAPLFEETTDRDGCEQECAARESSAPNRQCRFGTDVFRPHPIDTCLILGGCGAEIYRAQTDSCRCHEVCGDREERNRSCSFGTDEFRPTPLRECLILGGCGVELLREPSTDCASCRSECDALADAEHRSCLWSGDVLRATPRDRCLIRGGAGAILFDETTIHCDCLMECDAREESNPNRTCEWGSVMIR